MCTRRGARSGALAWDELKLAAACDFDDDDEEEEEEEEEDAHGSAVAVGGGGELRPPPPRSTGGDIVDAATPIAPLPPPPLPLPLRPAAAASGATLPHAQTTPLRSRAMACDAAAATVRTPLKEYFELAAALQLCAQCSLWCSSATPALAPPAALLEKREVVEGEK